MSAAEYIEVSESPNKIKSHKVFVKCIDEDILPGTGVSSASFWYLMNSVVETFSTSNFELLRFRDTLQKEIDEWYRSGCQVNQTDFLRKIGYLVKSPSCSEICLTTAHVDPEIAQVASPQLVVPVDNDRFVVNAVNSRWGSLSTAVSSTDVLGKNPSRDQVRGYLMDFLDHAAPLLTADASWRKVSFIGASRLGGSKGATLKIVLEDGRVSGLRMYDLWVGWSLNAVFLKHNGLHIWIQTNPEGKGIADVILESSLTAILDLEDSVAAVDAYDKSKAYANWAKIMAGDMKVDIGGSVRSLRDDIYFRTPEGSIRSLPGRVLSLIRNVGIHCRTNIVLHADNTEVYEGLVDAVVTVVAALRDIRSGGSSNGRVNSRTGSIYVVKPKLHGPEEVRFACSVFAHIENALGLPLNTVKIGIMDEERRTSVNLRACIEVAQQRVFFINTGFLDRTGDEIHTCMRGGPVLPKSEIKSSKWIQAYERLNVINGVAAGFLGKAQIGKGMWAEPDSMKAMMDQKIFHPKSAASTAWVPSPVAATLHAIHYHTVNVRAVQRTIDTNSVVSSLESDLLTPPLMTAQDMQKFLTPDLIRKELLNNAQGVLGYVVRWVDQGIGCSKVPDIRNVGLMEDLATLRISSQYIANWMLHGVVSEKQVIDAFTEMARTVDEQNSKDPKYVPMCSSDLKNNAAFNAALQLVKQGTKLPNGYSIGLLVEARRRKKGGYAAKRSSL